MMRISIAISVPQAHRDYQRFLVLPSQHPSINVCNYSVTIIQLLSPCPFMLPCESMQPQFSHKLQFVNTPNYLPTLQFRLSIIFHLPRNGNKTQIIT